MNVHTQLNQENQKIIYEMFNTILGELDYFKDNFAIIDHYCYGLELLEREPFIGYVKANVDKVGEVIFLYSRQRVPLNNKQRKTYEPCKKNILLSSYQLTGAYHRHIRNLHTLDVGEEFDFEYKPDYRELDFKRVFKNLTKIHGVILEKNFFIPSFSNYIFDAFKNETSIKFGVYSQSSEREYIKEVDRILEIEKQKKQIELQAELAKKAQEQVRLETLLKEIDRLEKEQESLIQEKLQIKKGKIRETVNNISLRDQPNLDKVQNKIAKIDLANQIVVTGAPGTGKTTILIKRVALKTSKDFLLEEEYENIHGEELSYFFNPQNWIMFTPNVLLKIYLKEAFAKENLAASDSSIKIWSEESKSLARECLGFLGNKESGKFGIAKEPILQLESNDKLLNYVEVFESFYKKKILTTVEDTLTRLESHQTSPDLIAGFKKINTNWSLFEIIRELHKLRPYFDEYKKQIANIIKELSTEIIKSHPDILNKIIDLTHKIKELDSDLEANESNPLIEEITEETETEGDHRTESKDLLIANNKLKQSIRWYATKQLVEKSKSKKGINFEIAHLIADYLSAKRDILITLGKQIVDCNISNVLTQGYTNLLNKIPAYYQEFRKEQIGNSVFLNALYKKQILEKKLSSHEIDIINFIILQNTRTILKRESKFLKEDSKIEIIEKIKKRYKTQIVVDEATDFSPIQLGCMFYLTHPQFNSFSIAGDLMQRITTEGLTTWESCNVFAKLEVHKVDKIYRQSNKLLQIAKKLYEETMQAEAPFSSAFELNEFEPDPLKFCSENDENLATWITDRIEEIKERNNSELPSIAVFVSTEEQIDIMHRIVEESLLDIGIELERCHQGKILGNTKAVRIFSIAFIKGLEFESAFFINLDEMTIQFPDLANKYFYVGLTRAALFLAVTYRTHFPTELKCIENDFKENTWKI